LAKSLVTGINEHPFIFWTAIIASTINQKYKTGGLETPPSIWVFNTHFNILAPCGAFATFCFSKKKIYQCLTNGPYRVGSGGR